MYYSNDTLEGEQEYLLWLTNDLQDNQCGFFDYRTNQSKSIQQIIINQKEGKQKIMAAKENKSYKRHITQNRGDSYH
jgi:hypothetical protein